MDARTKAEIRALDAAGRAADGQGNPLTAQQLAREALSLYIPTQTLLEQVTVRALSKVATGTVSVLECEPSKEPWTKYLYETLAITWTHWAAGEREEVSKTVARIKEEQRVRRTTGTGAVHLLAIFYWASALDQLAKNNLTESRRLWKRALDLGSSFGTDSHPIVLWTYVASFCPVAG